MSKGQQRSNREAKKPKTSVKKTKPASTGSAFSTPPAKTPKSK